MIGARLPSKKAIRAYSPLKLVVYNVFYIPFPANDFNLHLWYTRRALKHILPITVHGQGHFFSLPHFSPLFSEAFALGDSCPRMAIF
jgi:hypothetical protein